MTFARTVATILCLALPAAAPAQSIDIDAIRAQAKAGADEFAQLRELLRDQDVNVRLAAFDAMVAHGAPTLYELATSAAIADTDEVVRARAMWEILIRTRNLAVIVDPEGEVTAEKARDTLRDAYQGRMNFQVGNALKDLNCINLYYEKEGECVGGYNLSVNGTRVNFVYANQNLDGSMVLDTDGVLRGMMRNTRYKIEFPVEVPLR